MAQIILTLWVTICNDDVVVVSLKMPFSHSQEEKETPEIIPPLLWAPNSLDLNPVDDSVEHTAREGVQNTHN